MDLPELQHGELAGPPGQPVSAPSDPVREAGRGYVTRKQYDTGEKPFTVATTRTFHEPLRRIQLYASMLLESGEDRYSSKQLKSLTAVHRNAKKMQKMLEQLVTLSRIDPTSLILVSKPLGAVVEEAISALRKKVEQKRAQIVIHEMPDVPMQPLEMRELFIQLLENSLKYSRRGVLPVIQISAETGPGARLNREKLHPRRKYCRLRFEDNGHGFEQKYAGRIFDMFYRLCDDQSDSTGAGLAICKKIVEAHQGVIQATGYPGKGACIEIYLPL